MSFEQPSDPENIRPHETGEPIHPGPGNHEQPFAFGPGETSLPLTDVPATEHAPEPYLPPELTPARLQKEARSLALAEADPIKRVGSLGALIAEGDHDMVDLAVIALRESPDVLVENGEPNGHKVTAGQTLIEVLADRELFAQAEEIITLIKPLDEYAAINRVSRLLEKGYAGQNDNFLHISHTSALEDARTKGRGVPVNVLIYLGGLTGYGMDVHDATTPAGKLYTTCMALTPQQSQRDYYMCNLVDSYTCGGHVDQAIALKNHIADPYWRSTSTMYAAQAAQESGDPVLANSLFSEAQGLTEALRDCDGSCKRPLCNPPLDVQSLEVSMAKLRITQGDVTSAQVLVGPIHPILAEDQAYIHARIYQQTGDESARAAAIAAITAGNPYRRNEADGQLVEVIGAADMRWHNTMPSFEPDAEVAPLICWELHTIYGQKHEVEKQMETQGPNEREQTLMDLLYTDPNVYVGRIAGIRSEIRDHSLARLAKLLAATGAPQTARNLADLIQTPAEKVRALAGMAQALQKA